MSSDFPYVRLGDYTNKIGSGSTPRGGSSVYLEKGEFTLIRSQNIYNNGFNINGLVYITSDAADKLKSVSIHENDILLNITGDSVARVCIAPLEFLPARVNQHVAIIRVNELELDSKYIRYFLSSPRMQKTMLSLASTGGTRNALTKSMIENFDVPKPLLREQQKIASILSSLDDKIECNNKMNQMLEKMAQTLFKEWFEEFNFPNAEGKPYKTNKGAMQTSELGEIPEGWEVTTLGNIGRVVTGKTPSTKNKEYWGNMLEFITPTDFKNYGKFTAGSERSLSLVGAEKIKNNVLPINSILVTCIGSDMGKVVISQSECVTNQQINSLVIDNLTMVEYVYQYIIYIYPLLRAISMGGSTMPIINKTDFQNIEIILPSSDLVEEFHNIIYAFNEQIKQNQEQTQTLTKLRDTLLPKLMSGEIKV